MLKDTIIAMLWSVSPFGEAKVGIPYGLFNDVNIYLVFVVCFAANVLVFPIMKYFLHSINTYCLRWYFYKKAALWVARRAKVGSADKIKKYGFWGLMFFVSLPIPGTGVYAGTIAAYLFNFETKKAFLANTIGIFISSVIVWSTTLATMEGIAA
ncbi:small multi-drug export protein [Altibacter sp. HG106]|nr:small multi-drug export protein [Altibacter sp. HG106]MDC7995348.1 small multi-drug export protein [Altibacter sp. HG106]